jgi:antitoxin YefM
MRERLELLEDVLVAGQQLASDQGIAHDEAKARVLRRLEK